MNTTQHALDFSELPVLDNHCHLFNTDYEPHEIHSLLSMSLNEMPEKDLRQTMVYRTYLRELRSLLQHPGAGEEELLAERTRRIQADTPGWISTLFQDCALETLLIDLGYKPAHQNLETFEKRVPATIHYLFRIESVLDELWDRFQNRELDLAEVESRFESALDENLAQSNIVGFKTIIGYRTGLQVQPVERSRLLDQTPREKPFRDYFFLRMLDKTKGSGLPIQIHAAFGESNIDIRMNSPALLKWVLDQEAYRSVPIILVHGGYPRCFEAGYLASVYPNVHVDISEMIPFAPLGHVQGLRDILDMCPFSKILYGSDGFIVPDIHWLGARLAKQTLAALFSELIEAGLFKRSEAMSIGRMILADNARNLYALNA